MFKRDEEDVVEVQRVCNETDEGSEKRNNANTFKTHSFIRKVT